MYVYIYVPLDISYIFKSDSYCFLYIFKRRNLKATAIWVFSEFLYWLTNYITVVVEGRDRVWKSDVFFISMLGEKPKKHKKRTM